MTDVSAYQRLHPRAYLQKFLEENIRPDGRNLDEVRSLQITTGKRFLSLSPQCLLSTPSSRIGSISTADGSALVKLGATTVVCGVKAEIAEPELDAPMAGFIGVK